jgi:predicted nucleic acid-binding protein
VILVVDASVAVKWFIRESLHEDAVQLLDYPEQLHSLDLLIAEVTNTAWRKSLRGEITPEQAREIAATIRRGTPLLYPTAAFNERALDLALNLQHTVYDCLYLACAEALEGLLVTDDREFYDRAASAGFQNHVFKLGTKPISAIIQP